MKPKLLFYSQGKAVEELQSKLNLLMPEKMPRLVVDGIFGQQTYQRVKEFQVKRGLVADGIVGGYTWAALDGTPPPPGAPKPAAPTPAHKVKGTPVMNGSVLRCQYGAAPSLILLAPGRQATIRDCSPLTNILPFGFCNSPGNPAVAAASSAAMGVLTPQPCFPVTMSWWSAAQPVQLVGPEQLPAIDASCTVTCAWGGVISVK